jgi:hypothetical protein
MGTNLRIGMEAAGNSIPDREPETHSHSGEARISALLPIRHVGDGFAVALLFVIP